MHLWPGFYRSSHRIFPLHRRCLYGNPGSLRYPCQRQGCGGNRIQPGHRPACCHGISETGSHRHHLHIRTKDVGKYCRSADIIVSAAGCRNLGYPPPWSVQDRPSSMWASTLQKTGESAAMWIFPTYPLLWTPSPRFPAASVPSLQHTGPACTGSS